MVNKIFRSKIFAHCEILVSAVSVKVAKASWLSFTIHYLEDYLFRSKYPSQMISLTTFTSKMVIK